MKYMNDVEIREKALELIKKYPQELVCSNCGHDMVQDGAGLPLVCHYCSPPRVKTFNEIVVSHALYDLELNVEKTIQYANGRKQQPRSRRFKVPLPVVIEICEAVVALLKGENADE